MRRLLLTAIIFGLSAPVGRCEWRSSLYPEDWQPGYRDRAGRFLHDFSYAGYHIGEKPLPEIRENIRDVTRPPYSADNTGQLDVTQELQKALDDAGRAGGGVVYLPAGTYRIRPPDWATVALRIRYDNVVLRGAGAGRTFLFNDCFSMRQKQVLEVKADDPADWHFEGAGVLSAPVVENLLNQAVHIPVADPSGFAAGDLVVIRSDLTQRFIDELEMTGKWKPAGADSPDRTLIFCRRIRAVDLRTRTLKIDVPIRFPMKLADKTRVNKIKGRLISEVGLEGFSIGMKQHPGDGLAEEDWKTADTVAYDAHRSSAIIYSGAENCWIRKVHSYAPGGNAPDIHLLSNGLNLFRSRFVTAEECDLKFPQYRGGGGNGYLYSLQAQECLVKSCKAEGARHNYTFAAMACSGNVITNCHAKNGRLASDFHSYLSIANLLDQITCEGDLLEARAYRPWGNPPHGLTTTQSVFWNITGLAYSGENQVLIESHQFGDGYVIGTSGPAHKVDSGDHVEGIGKGDTLVPRSLYADQLARRLQKELGESGR